MELSMSCLSGPSKKTTRQDLNMTQLHKMVIFHC